MLLDDAISVIDKRVLWPELKGMFSSWSSTSRACRWPVCHRVSRFEPLKMKMQVIWFLTRDHLLWNKCQNIFEVILILWNTHLMTFSPTLQEAVLSASSPIALSPYSVRSDFKVWTTQELKQLWRRTFKLDFFLNLTKMYYWTIRAKIMKTESFRRIVINVHTTDSTNRIMTHSQWLWTGRHVPACWSNS